MPEIDTRPLFFGPSTPYPGLRSFESSEELIFRGRQKQTEELLHRLAEHRFLAVVGTSGSGKSSLIRAGLLPALERGFLVGTSSRWRVAVTRPGSAPIDNLTETLRGSEAQQAGFRGMDATILRSSRLGLVEVVQKAGLESGESLLLVVDQFEEIFRYRRHTLDVDSATDAVRFVNLLLTAADRPNAPVYVVLTMRSDFLGDCSQFSGLPEALSQSQYLIPRLTRGQRRQAIEEPLQFFGARMTSQLVEQLLNDSGDESFGSALGSPYHGGKPDPLPVLQHALMRTYLHWKSLPDSSSGQPIDLKHYQDAGGMDDALNRHAERLFAEELDDGKRRWAERIFRCLTATELGRPIRRPMLLANLYKTLELTDGETEKVYELLGLFRQPENSFLQIHRDTSVDITHESLIWKWKRLGDWVAKEAASAELYCEIAKDAARKETWRGYKLTTALKARQEDGWNPAWAALYYPDCPFEFVVSFLERSKRSARNQMLVRWLVAFCLFASVLFAVWFSFWSKAQSEKMRAQIMAQMTRSRIDENQRFLRALSDKIRNLQSDPNPKSKIQGLLDFLQAQFKISNEERQRFDEVLNEPQPSAGSASQIIADLTTQLKQAQQDRDKAIQDRNLSVADANQLKQAQRDRENAVRNPDAIVEDLTTQLKQAQRDRDNAILDRDNLKRLMSSNPNPSGNRESDRSALILALDEYKNLFTLASGKKASDCKLIFEIPFPGKMREFEKWCSDQKTFTVSEECSQQIGGSPDAPTLTCTEKVTVELKDGKTNFGQPQQKTFQLVRSPGWRVSGWK